MDFVINVIKVFTILAAVSGIWIFWTKLVGAQWVPTPMHTVNKMLEIAQVKPGDVVYDLGSGDGRVIITAARRFGARAVGIEIDPLRYIWTQILIRFLGLGDQVRVIYGNIYDQNLEEADVVTAYLLQDTNEKLMIKLVEELQPGTRVVSHKFTFPAWALVQEDSEDRIINLYIAGKLV